MYIVDYEKYERKLFEGEFPVVIESYDFKIRNYNGFDLEMVNLKLVISDGEYKGSWLFDAIFENIEEGQDYASWDHKKMNKYSGALEIPKGTEFENIYQWLEYIKGKEVVAVVKIKGEYQRVQYVKPYRKEEENDLSHPDLNF